MTRPPAILDLLVLRFAQRWHAALLTGDDARIARHLPNEVAQNLSVEEFWAILASVLSTPTGRDLSPHLADALRTQIAARASA